MRPGLEHCGRAVAAYGKTATVNPASLFGSPSNTLIWITPWE